MKKSEKDETTKEEMDRGGKEKRRKWKGMEGGRERGRGEGGKGIARVGEKEGGKINNSEGKRGKGKREGREVHCEDVCPQS